MLVFVISFRRSADSPSELGVALCRDNDSSYIDTIIDCSGKNVAKVYNCNHKHYMGCFQIPE